MLSLTTDHRGLVALTSLLGVGCSTQPHFCPGDIHLSVPLHFRCYTELHGLCRPGHPLAALMEREDFFSASCSSGALPGLGQRGTAGWVALVMLPQHSWARLGRAEVFQGSFCTGNHPPPAHRPRATCSCLYCILSNTAGI